MGIDSNPTRVYFQNRASIVPKEAKVRKKKGNYLLIISIYFKICSIIETYASIDFLAKQPFGGSGLIAFPFPNFSPKSNVRNQSNRSHCKFFHVEE